MATDQAKPARFGAVFRHVEFQALWSAQVLSIAGDQLARVSLTLLVYARTDSAVLTAFTYALTFLPDLFGGPLLSGLADRYPRRTVMVVCDLARAALVGLMAIPGVPLAALCVLLVIVQLLNSPFTAARSAVLPAVLDGDLYVAGQAIMNITYQTGLLAGYVVGGALVAFTGTSVALAIDAATFLASALLVRFGTRHRAVPVNGTVTSVETPGTLHQLRDGARLVWHDRSLRALISLACVSGFYVIAEGLAVPYSHELHGGPVTAGLLFAAAPAGTAVGMTLLTRLVRPPVRLRMLGPLAVMSCAVLIVCATQPGLAVTLAVWFVSGVCVAYQTVAAAEFVRAVPDSGRGLAFGLASTSLRVAQGLGVVLAGAFAERFAPSWVVAVAGALGALVALAAAGAWRAATHGRMAEFSTPAES